eukprot:6175987-Pleurochrysis_carterae.AAC.2
MRCAKLAVPGPKCDSRPQSPVRNRALESKVRRSQHGTGTVGDLQGTASERSTLRHTNKKTSDEQDVHSWPAFVQVVNVIQWHTFIFTGLKELTTARALPEILICSSTDSI